MKKLMYLSLLISSLVFAYEDVTSDDTSTKETEVMKEQLLSNKDMVIDLNSIQKAFFNDKSDGKTVNIYKYNLDETIKIRTRIFMKSTVILPKGEIPISAVFGDSSSFSIELLKDMETKYKLDNIFTVKANFLGADSNLTVLGASGRVYSFYLYSIGTDDTRKPNLLNYVTLDGKLPPIDNIDNLDEKDKTITTLSQQVQELEKKLLIQEEDKGIDLTKFNISGTQFDYRFKNELMLEAVFNDQNNTYFKFKDGFSVPKFFYKDTLNNNISVPYSIEKNVVKIKRLNKDWVIEVDNRFLEINKIGKFEFKESNKKWLVDMTKTDFSFLFTSGNEELKPEAVFHDNEFTYFKFDLSNGFKKFPTIFKVLDGYDSPILNYEVIGDFIVAKSVNVGFTFRLGEQHFCVRYAK